MAAAVTESYGDLTSNADVLDLLEGCNLTAGDLAEIGAGLGTPEEAVKMGIATSMKNIGLSDEQANCVADAYVKKYGTDIAPSQNASTVSDLFDELRRLAQRRQPRRLTADLASPGLRRAGQSWPGRRVISASGSPS